MSEKYKRLNILDLRANYPDQFGRFIMALKNLINSDDWGRICGIHGNTFNPHDKQVKCPTDPETVTKIGATGEPFYCKHSVYSFIAWHAPYVYQYELLLNKYNKSTSGDHIALPWLDLTDFSDDYSFINDPQINILYDGKMITTENPLSTAYYYVNGVRTRITRNGYLTPTTNKEYVQLTTVKNQLNGALAATNFEEFSSAANKVVSLTPLEQPHNSLHNIIGGEGGNMSSIDIAAFDPLFWLHHCNMDRYYYSWYSNITNNFTEPLYPNFIQEETMNKPCAPFFPDNVFSTDYTNYEYGWKNCTGHYAKVSDVIDIKNFPYTYDIVKPLLTASTLPNSFIRITDVSVPLESVEINVYMYLKDKELDKNKDFAGSAFWFGINQQKIFCQRCKSIKTNFTIDINNFVRRNQITQSNINNYNILIEADGFLLRKKYTQEELAKDGNVTIVVPE